MGKEKLPQKLRPEDAAKVVVQKAGARVSEGFGVQGFWGLGFRV